MRTTTIIITALSLLAVAAATAAAQPAPRARERRAAAVRERIQLLRGHVLADELALDEVAAGRLTAVLDRYDAAIDDLHARGARLRRELRRETEAPGGADDRELERRTDELLAHYEELYRTQRERFAAARRAVSAAQGARLLLVLPRIDDQIRREIERAVKHDRRRRGRFDGR